MTTSSIEFDYRPLFDTDCFVVSLKGLPICITSTPIIDTAHFLKKAGVADEAGFDMWLEGSDIGASYSVGHVISASTCKPQGVTIRAGAYLMR
jgi:hypothetical protein